MSKMLTKRHNMLKKAKMINIKRSSVFLWSQREKGSDKKGTTIINCTIISITVTIIMGVIRGPLATFFLKFIFCIVELIPTLFESDLYNFNNFTSTLFCAQHLYIIKCNYISQVKAYSLLGYMPISYVAQMNQTHG